jgi:hypothetical protein
MDSQLKSKIYDEMFMYMTEKNNKNQYINGDLTRRKIKQILLTTFNFNLSNYKEYIHQIWNTIKEQIHEEIDEFDLSLNLSNININN